MRPSSSELLRSSSDPSNQPHLFLRRTAMNKPIPQSEMDALNAQATDASSKKALRKKLFAALLAGVTICGAGYCAYDYFIGSRYVTTDNAYVGAETAHVTPLVGGPVEAVLVSDTDTVKA